jgi:uncharacterized protein (DUF1778 family)
MPETDRQTYTETIRVRVRPEHGDLVRKAAASAAERSGTGDLSSWVRRVLIREARRELGR